jgi:P27 family predicted phage terminase small subunit
LGRRGPPPMPTELKLLHGERRPSRLNRNAPKAKNVPVMPEGMSAPAQAIWNRLTADYAHTGVLTSVDADALQIYCEAVVRYRHGAKMLEQSGPLVRGARRGDLVKNPLHQVVRDDADLVRAFARELGFTPSARSALTAVNEPEEGDALDRWMAGKTG